MAITKADVLRELKDGVGCLGKATDDEPIFILRGQDIFAAGLVERWAFLAEGRRADPKKVAEARDIAQKMKMLPNRKYPD